MFRFRYATTPGESWNEALTAAGFDGVESDGAAEGVARTGQARTANVPDSSNHDAAGQNSAQDYVSYAVGTGPASAEGRRLSALAEAMPGTLVLAETNRSFATAHDLWTLLEAARHPRVKLALDVDAARVAGQTAAVLVPTLNLRIGLIRVREDGADVTAYARRLAGIGFDGFVVIDPPPGVDRVAAAVALAAVFRAVLPAKPVKKAAAAKAAK